MLWRSLALSRHIAGVYLVSGYDMQGHVEDDPPWKDTVFGFRRVSRDELVRVGGEAWCVVLLERHALEPLSPLLNSL
jgi:hypothetical protein